MRRIATVVVWVTVGMAALLANIPLAQAMGTDPPQVVVRGVDHFSAKQVTRQLDRALWFQAVYGAPYQWNDPTIALPHMTVAAYRKAGFRDVTVRARLEPTAGTIELDIKEGCQFVAGNIRVESATQIAAARVIARLAERVEPEDAKFDTFVFRNNQFQPLWVTEKGQKAELQSPLWSPGHPIAFNATGDLLLSDRLADVFTDIGYPQTQARVEVHAAAEGVLDLVVHIDDEGPRLTAGTIEIFGIERNTREDVLAFLEIQPGDPLDRNTRIDLHRRLWMSARFASVEVAADEAVSPTEASLRITLEEYEKAPPLGQKLTEAEEVMLRLHRWFACLPQSDTALRFRSDGEDARFDVVFSPGRALAIEYAGVRVLLTPNQVDYYSDFQKRKLQTKVGAEWFGGAVSLKLNEDRSEGNALYDLKFWWFYSSEHKSDSGPRRNFGMRVPPVLCLALLNGRAIEHSIDEGVLSIRSPKESLRIEAATGRLLEFRLVGNEGASAGTIEFVELPLDEFVAKQWPEVASYADALVPMRPVSSVTRLLVRDWQALSEQWPEKPAFLDKYPPELQRVFVALADHALLNTIDDFVLQAWSEAQGDPSRPRFKVGKLTPYLRHALPEGQRAWIPLMWRDLGGNLFPAGSWHHDAAMALLGSWAGCKRIADYHWNRVLTAPNTGPIRDVIAATHLQQKHVGLAHHLALHGLGLLDLSGFHRDLDVLLDESAYIGRFLVHAAEVLRSAEPEGLDALLMYFPDAWEPGLTAALIHLRFYPDQPTWQTLPEALDSAWESHWKALVEAKLKAIEAATRPKPK